MSKETRSRKSRSSPARESTRSRSKSKSKSPGIKRKDASPKRRDVGALPTDRETVTPRTRRSTQVARASSVTLAQTAKDEKKKILQGPTKSRQRIWFTLLETIGCIFAILLFAVLQLMINIVCNLKSCRFTEMPHISTALGSYLDVKAILIYSLMVAISFLLSFLPVGSVIERRYRCNSLVVMATYIVIFLVLFYFQLPVFDTLLNLFIPLSVSGIIFSIIFSLFLVILGRRKLKSPGNFFKDYLFGCQVNPVVGKLNIKQILIMRTGVIYWLLIDILVGLQAYYEQTLNFTLAIVIIFQLVYVTDMLVYEFSVFTTMTFTTDRTGFLLIDTFTSWIPFVNCIQVIYIYLHKITLSYPVIIGYCLLYAVGYIIYRGSNNQKDSFRRNPRSTAFISHVTVPTTTGKPLLCSGWWGICRHPNYLGDLLMGISWSLPCGISSAVSYFYPVFTLLILLFRISDCESKCQQKYAAAWHRYCQIVRSKLIPYIY